MSISRMSISRWDPFEDVGMVRRSMERLFDDFFTRRPGTRDALTALKWEPAIEMYETEGDLIVRAELPNIDPNKVDITVTNEAVTLRGETRSEEEQKGRNYYRRELRYGAFSRTLPLVAEVKSNEARASYKDGVLEVKIPKSERVKPTSVRVPVEK